MVENLSVESQTHVWRDHSHLRKLQLASLQNAPRKRRNENKHPKLPLAIGFLINTRYWVPTQIAIDMPLKNPSMKMYKHELWETLLRVPRSCFWPVSGTSLCLSFLCWVTCVPSLAMPTLYVCRCVCMYIYIYTYIHTYIYIYSVRVYLYVFSSISHHRNSCHTMPLCMSNVWWHSAGMKFTTYNSQCLNIYIYIHILYTSHIIRHTMTYNTI